MSAEAIARVIADIKAGRIRAAADSYDELLKLNEDTVELASWGTVVDATTVFDQFMHTGAGRAIYEDHRCRPVWDNAFVCFVNSYGNVNVMSVRVVRMDVPEDTRKNLVDHWQSLADTHTIDWDRVKWVMHVVIYGGGTTGVSKGTPMPAPTCGPLHCWRIAIYPDGEIADINWINVTKQFEAEHWTNALMVLLDTYNLGNCVNVELAEPHRQRSQARRLQRLGVTVSEIHIRPVSRSYRGKGTPLSQLGSSPLSSVRGHTAIYGMEGRGKLFGKYTGRFWIPQHVRGSAAFGEVEQQYKVEM